MTVISEQTSTAANAIDAIANAATSLADWDDADTNVVVANDSTKPEWYNNGRALFHSPSGQYLLMHVSNKTGGGGIVFNVSSDWNNTEGRPSGNTTVDGAEPYAQYVATQRSESFATTRTYSSMRPYHTILFEADENTTSNIYEAGQLEINFFASVGPTHLTIGLWRNSTDGRAGAHSFEHVNNKFWSDGNAAWAQTLTGNDDSYNNDYHTTSYGWSYSMNDQDGPSPRPPYYSRDGTEASKWGFVNPSSTDDTFFFKNAILYENTSETTPVAYADGAIANTSSGGAHGDTVTYNGTTYRIMRQNASKSTHVSQALRYE